MSPKAAMSRTKVKIVRISTFRDWAISPRIEAVNNYDGSRFLRGVGDSSFEILYDAVNRLEKNESANTIELPALAHSIARGAWRVTRRRTKPERRDEKEERRGRLASPLTLSVSDSGDIFPSLMADCGGIFQVVSGDNTTAACQLPLAEAGSGVASTEKLKRNLAWRHLNDLRHSLCAA